MADYTIALYEKPDDFNALVEQNTKNGWKSLTPELRIFCYYYLEDYNHQNAAKRANIKMSGMTALRNPLVNAMIAHLQEAMQQRSLIDADFVRVQWLNMLPKLMGEEEVAMVDKDGVSYMAKKFHAAESVRTLTELGKSTKFYAGGSGQGGQVNISINLAALGIEEKNITSEGSYTYVDQDV